MMKLLVCVKIQMLKWALVMCRSEFVNTHTHTHTKTKYSSVRQSIRERRQTVITIILLI